MNKKRLGKYIPQSSIRFHIEALPDSDIDVMIEIDEYSPEIESAVDDIVYEPYSSSKHSGVLSYFNRRFVTGGIFSENLGRSINKALELRQRWDCC